MIQGYGNSLRQKGVGENQARGSKQRRHNMRQNKTKRRQDTNPAAFHFISHIAYDQINRNRRQSVLQQAYSPKSLFSCYPHDRIQKQCIARLPVGGHGQITVCVRIGRHASPPQKPSKQSPEKNRSYDPFSSFSFLPVLHIPRNLPIRYFPFAIPNSFHRPQIPLFPPGIFKYSSKEIHETSCLWK